MPVLPETRSLDDYPDHDPDIDWHGTLAEVDRGLQDMTLAVASMQATLARLMQGLPPRAHKPAEIIDIAGYSTPEPPVTGIPSTDQATEPAPAAPAMPPSALNWSGAEPPAWQPQSSTPAPSMPEASPLPTLPRWLNDPEKVQPRPAAEAPVARGFSTGTDSTNPGSWPTGGFKKPAEPAHEPELPAAEIPPAESVEP